MSKRGSSLFILIIIVCFLKVSDIPGSLIKVVYVSQRLRSLDLFIYEVARTKMF